MFKFNEKLCDKVFLTVYISCFCFASIYMMYPGDFDKKVVEVEEPKIILPENSEKDEKKLNAWKSFCEEFIKRRSKCFPGEETPGDKEQKHHEDNEMVIHISILLLQASLIWTIIDFVDRYLKHGKKEIEKAPLNRTCSLADITLMRHQRRESMRKDYSLDLSQGRNALRSFGRSSNRLVSNL